MAAIKPARPGKRGASTLGVLAPSFLPKHALAPATWIQGDHVAGIDALVAAYRANGWRAATLDPMSSAPSDPDAIPELKPDIHGVSRDGTFRYRIELGGHTQLLSLPELEERLRTTYCESIGLDCAHIRSSDQRHWLYAQIEIIGASPAFPAREALRALELLVRAETFEQYQRATYPRHKQFSLEGSESLVPLLVAAIEEAARHGVGDIVLGMPHRGRLNVLRNVFGLAAERLFSLFSDAPTADPAAWDLKDHFGCSARNSTAYGDITLLLAHNPSHLESVSPIVCGMARALQDRNTRGIHPKVMPVLIHGDASFSAQGVVTETLNLSQTRGYGVGGTLHLILNNQIGSTVSHPRDARSTLFCADLARAIEAPIVHVNADDPEAVVAVARLATEYRMRFGEDIVIDHIGYRRHGHFGGDDPTQTRPATQRRIDGHWSVVAIYAGRLESRGIAAHGQVEHMKAAELIAMSEGRPPEEPRSAPEVSPAAAPPALPNVVTAVPVPRLQEMVRRLAAVPPDFALHPGVRKMIDDWRWNAADIDLPLDWCLAENLAYASLLANGFNIRLSGLDVGRGSFFHRYHVWHDQAAEIDWQKLHIPLRHVAEGQGSFSIFESPLSEEAVLGFEYGYSLRSGRDLVVWEAQFGDFVNNAQTVIDQYIATGERKWGYRSGLVMLLPHGHEGGGPEHSCAYLGRFLQLCAEGNLQVAMPSTAAQLYHLLRRQALNVERKPLIVMTPKMWLYGHRASHSSLRALAEGEFRNLLGEEARNDRAVFRVIVTSGKLYYDLAAARDRAAAPVPILRVEQLYPFPRAALAAELRGYPKLKDVVWAQEEAKNHGAWHLLREELEAALPRGVSLVYAGRPAAAPSAACKARVHALEQEAIVASALGTAGA